MPRIILQIVFATLLCVGALMPRAAVACEFGYCWGAVAFGPLGTAGYATRLSTAPDAENRARAACGEDCMAVEVFNDACAALAVDREDAYQVGFGGTRTDAETAARENCEAMELYCVVRVSACSHK